MERTVADGGRSQSSVVDLMAALRESVEAAKRERLQREALAQGRLLDDASADVLLRDDASSQTPEPPR